MPDPVLVIHGGCGTLARAVMAATREVEFRAGLAASLKAGWTVLEKGGKALDAVVEAVAAMEDDPNFNAGHGAVFTEDGAHELDAAVMEGALLHAGALCAARRIRNPVRVAAALARRSDPLMLAGEGADRWAEARGFATVDNAWFDTGWRRDALAEMRRRRAAGTTAQAAEADKHGTVGAVALDASGHLAAATSTGGYTAKPAGRVGDTPIIGAGTWADDRGCAVSATGKGEFFIRRALAHEIDARVRLGGMTLVAACDAMVHGELKGWAAGAGLVAVDRAGNWCWPFNTEGMYRGVATRAGTRVAIYAE
jgi:beta-aspartyl-peptidase (threonine type)